VNILRTLGITPTPGRAANGTERWATIADDDSDTVITLYRGWVETGSVRLCGSAATADLDTVIRTLRELG
jgi:hypothetical protein